MGSEPTNLCHELRTPLNAILGFAEMMKLELLGPLAPPAYRAYAADIHSAGEQLLAVVTKLLDRDDGST